MGDVSALSSLFGQRVVGARRGRFHAADGTVDDDGFLELTAESGAVVVLDVASDWTLAASTGPWVDHFAEPLDDDNRGFVRTHGKWSAADLSRDLAEALIGAHITSASLMHDEMGGVMGVRLVTHAATTIVACDREGDLHVKVERG